MSELPSLRHLIESEEYHQLLVWGYALAWFLLNDQVKLAAYRIFDWQQPGLLAKSRR